MVRRREMRGTVKEIKIQNQGARIQARKKNQVQEIQRKKNRECEIQIQWQKCKIQIQCQKCKIQSSRSN